MQKKGVTYLLGRLGTSRHLLSIGGAAAFVMLLIFSGPTLAVLVGVGSPSNTTVEKGNNISFEAYVDISEPENLPVTNLTVWLNNTDGAVNFSCVFTPTGVAITGCSSFAITLLNLSMNWTLASDPWGFGYGYGTTSSTYEWSNFTYAAGFGYGYTPNANYSLTGTAELHYNITFTAPSVSSDANYTVSFMATANDSSNVVHYSSYYTEQQNFVVLACVESWSCGDWGTCSSSAQTRTCTDSNACGTTSDRPALSQSCSSGGGGGGIAAPTTTTGPSAAKVWSVITPDASVALTITSDEIGITSIEVSVNTRLTNVEISVQRLNELPSGVSEPSATVYRYIEISTRNLEDSDLSESVKIEFKVTRAWLAENGFAEDAIALFRFNNGAWQELPTTMKSSDDTEVTYEAETFGFSTFAIGAKTVAPEAPSEEEGVVAPTGEVVAEGEEAEPSAPSCSDGTQNGDETGVDCGGSCEACPEPKEIGKMLRTVLFVFLIIAILAVIGILLWIKREDIEDFFYR